jgi:hypothetical protein
MYNSIVVIEGFFDTSKSNTDDHLSHNQVLQIISRSIAKMALIKVFSDLDILDSCTSRLYYR